MNRKEKKIRDEAHGYLYDDTRNSSYRTEIEEINSTKKLDPAW